MYSTQTVSLSSLRDKCSGRGEFSKDIDLFFTCVDDLKQSMQNYCNTSKWNLESVKIIFQNILCISIKAQ